MIDGIRLAEILIFERSVALRDVVRSADRLLDCDEKLASLRGNEILQWRSCAASGGNAPDEDVRNIERKLAERRSEARTLLSTIRQADAEIARLSNLIPQAESAVEEAKCRLAAKKEKVGRAIRRNIRILDLQQEISVIAQHVRQIGTWAAEADEIARELKKKYERNLLFRYLLACGYGTQSYRRFRPLARIDGWLAEEIGFAAASEHYTEASQYADRCAIWRQECSDRYEQIKQEIEAEEARERKVLAAEEKDVSDAVLELERIEGSIENAKADRTRSARKLVEIVLCRDGPGSTLLQALAELLRSAKRAATDHMIEHNRIDQISAARTDATVSERLRLAAEADLLRVQTLRAAGRLDNLDEALSKVILRKWDSSEVVFSLTEFSPCLTGIADGTVSADEAWPQIEAAVSPTRNVSVTA